ncbi:MAG TPA: hypothetical protein VFQ54_12060 [Thermomicrobiales bacterium]|nr:hypothetical protein [Thermomicrobiales bacterium]
MNPVIIHPGTAPGPDLVGLIVTQEVSNPVTGKRAFHKGHRIAAADLEVISRLDRDLHAVRIDATDVHEDVAGVRLAELIRGDGVTQRNPVQSRVNIVSERKWLLRVDAEAVFTINRHPGIGVFTALDRLPVLPGKIVAGAKIAPVAIPGETLTEIAGYLASRPEPMLRVKPFIPYCVGVIVTEGLSESVRDRFEGVVQRKLRWYGANVLRFEHVPNVAAAIANAADALLADGAELLLTAGGNMMDPLDASIQALPEFDASIVRLGAPAHPGSMFWLGYTNEHEIPVVNLASCSMYSKSTVADLVLPWVMAGEQVTSDDLATLGYGGLLDRNMGWRFPPYDEQEVDEPDEE